MEKPWSEKQLFCCKGSLGRLLRQQLLQLGAYYHLVVAVLQSWTQDHWRKLWKTKVAAQTSNLLGIIGYNHQPVWGYRCVTAAMAEAPRPNTCPKCQTEVGGHCRGWFQWHGGFTDFVWSCVLATLMMNMWKLILCRLVIFFQQPANATSFRTVLHV